jgi:hypothetical protein
MVIGGHELPDIALLFDRMADDAGKQIPVGIKWRGN